MKEPDLAEVIQAAVESALLNVHTFLPGIVTAYDEAKGTVEVEPQITRMIPGPGGKYVNEALPKLPHVKIAHQRTDTHVQYLPCSVGTFGLVFFCEVSMDRWRNKGALSAPADMSRHHISNGIFLPVLYPDCQLWTDDPAGGAVFGAVSGVQLRSYPDTMEVTTAGAANAADFVALAGKVDDFISKFDTVMRGWVPVVSPTVENGAALKTAYVAAFGSPPLSTASTNLKADGALL